ncbi:MAG: glycosyltransferase [Candidatus Woesearchaeota archaeon]
MVVVSVLMPNYNGDKYLKEAVNSILNQTFADFELLIVDDCSTDESLEVLRSFDDSRIKVFENSRNLGIVKTRNRLFSLMSSSSEFVAIMDSDDIALPTRLERQVAFLEKFKNIGIVGSNLIIIDENSKKIGTRSYSKNFSRSESFIKSPLAQPSVMISKKFLGDLRYSSEFEVAEDWDLWFRILKRCRGANIQEPLLKYRISTTQSKSLKLRRSIVNSLKVRFKYMGFKEYINVKILFRIVAECILLVLPSSFVMWLFKKMEIKK